MSEHHRRHHRKQPLLDRRKIGWGVGINTAIAIIAAGCSSPPPIISTPIRTITHNDSLPIQGIPSDQKIDPDCTVVTVTGGGDLAKVSGNGSSISVIPNLNVQGKVVGGFRVGKKNLLQQCETSATANFAVSVDTRAPVCNQVGTAPDAAVLSCDEGGIILAGGTQVADIKDGKAIVPVTDPSHVIKVMAVDSAGNKRETEVVIPTNCTQVVPLEIQYSSVRKAVEIKAQCDGNGVGTTEDGKFNVYQGTNWIGVPQNTSTIKGTVTVKGETVEKVTTFTLQRPPVPNPKLKVGEVRIDAGQVVADVTCQTALGDQCTLIEGTRVASEVYGDGKTVAKVKSPAVLSSQEPNPIPLIGCDTLSNCTQATIPHPEYKPFSGQFLMAGQGEGNLVTVTYKHPDPTDSLSGQILITATQQVPFQDAGWVTGALKLINSGSDVDRVSCAPTSHTPDKTEFACNTPYTHGTFNVAAQTQAKGGQWGPVFHSVVGQLDYAPEVQQAVEFGVPASFGIIGFVVLSLLARKYIERRKKEKIIRDREKVIRAINSPFYPSEQTLGQVATIIQAMPSAADRLTYNGLLSQKRKLMAIQMEDQKQVRVYNPTPLQHFLAQFKEIGETMEENNGFKNLSIDRYTLAQRLFGKLDDFIKRALISSNDLDFRISERIAERKDIYELMKVLYELKNDHWFWRMAQVKENAHYSDFRGHSIGVSSFQGVTRDRMVTLMLAHCKQQGNTENVWGMGLYDIIKRGRMGSKEEPMGFDEAQSIQERIKICQVREKQ